MKKQTKTRQQYGGYKRKRGAVKKRVKEDLNLGGKYTMQ